MAVRLGLAVGDTVKVKAASRRFSGRPTVVRAILPSGHVRVVVDGFTLLASADNVGLLRKGKTKEA